MTFVFVFNLQKTVNNFISADVCKKIYKRNNPEKLASSAHRLSKRDKSDSLSFSVKIIRVQNAFKTRFLLMAVLHFTFHENYIVSTGLYLIDPNLLSHQTNRPNSFKFCKARGKYELSRSIKFKTCAKWQNWQKSGGKENSLKQGKIFS